MPDLNQNFSSQNYHNRFDLHIMETLRKIVLFFFLLFESVIYAKKGC